MNANMLPFRLNIELLTKPCVSANATGHHQPT